MVRLGHQGRQTLQGGLLVCQVRHHPEHLGQLRHHPEYRHPF